MHSSQDNLGALRVVADLVDEVALDKPVDWESFKYEHVRDLAVIHSADTYKNIMMSDINDEEKVVTILSTMAYLMTENAVQWLMLERSRRQEQARVRKASK